MSTLKYRQSPKGIATRKRYVRCPIKQKAYMVEWRKKNKEKKNKYNREWSSRNRIKVRESDKVYNVKRRETLIELMKGKCECCGESDPIYLQFDHVNNDGCLDHSYQEKGMGQKRFRLTVNKYLDDPTRFQLLCASCNIAKHLNGGKLYKPKRKRRKDDS